MRRLVVSIIAASLIAAVFASPIAGETENHERLDFHRVQAAFDFSEGGRDFTGQIVIDRDNETGAAMAIFFFFSAVEVPCDNGTPEDPSDDYVAQDLIDFTTQQDVSTLFIGPNLSSATSSATAVGERIHLSCPDVMTSSPETVSWELTLGASGPTERTTEVNEFPNDDGTVETQTIKTAQRRATGTISIGDMQLVVRDATITHFRIVQKTH